ncbi:hypothetical protein [Pseudomonas sp. SG20052]|uniref:hypothetical protein n=1 Tax=Pseudomonas sp. SG20052 TaxID=3074147 RepID=UPI00287F55AC|nr:hypothetical protein [Pseudomonas sp. SG20052]WNF54033.1 hypothetical protein RHP74_22225 [Pseudomonas sp. SG20052]
MNSSRDYFMAGFLRAVERSKHQAKQSVQKVNSHIAESNADALPAAPSISYVKKFDAEQYRAKIISHMIALIVKNRSITANHSQ